MSAETFKLVVRGDFNNTDQTRNIFYLWNANGTIPSLATLTTYINSMWDAGFIAAVSNTWYMRSFDLYLWDAVQQYWSFVVNSALAKQGGGAAAATPQQIAYVLVARTAVKKVVPKKYIPGVTVDRVPGGAINAATMTLLNTFATCWATTQNQAGELFEPGTFTKSHVFTPLISVRADTIVGTQRRRKQGVGF